MTDDAKTKSGGPLVEPLASMKGPRRNAPCPCGSGKKYKKCHGALPPPPPPPGTGNTSNAEGVHVVAEEVVSESMSNMLVDRWSDLMDGSCSGQFPVTVVRVGLVTFFVTEGTGDGTFAYRVDEFEAGLDAAEESGVPKGSVPDEGWDHSLDPYQVFLDYAEATSDPYVAKSIYESVGLRIDEPGTCARVEWGSPN